MNLNDNLDEFLKNIGSLDPELKGLEPLLKKMVSDNEDNPDFKKNVLKGLKGVKKGLGNDGAIVDKMINKFFN